ncbi:MAG: hypothetical protein IPM82_23865, partial [Saprospiraceae bacterium]|nr:hypothetical protein [Saprospiraceae bacterium]
MTAVTGKFSFEGLANDGTVWAMNVDNQSYKRYPLRNKKLKQRLRKRASRKFRCVLFGRRQNLEIYQRIKGKCRICKTIFDFPANVGNLNLACSPGGDLFVTGNTGWLFWLKPPNPSLGRKGWETASFSKSPLGGSLPDDFHCVSVPTFDTKGRLWLKTCRGFSVFSTEKSRFHHFYIKQTGVNQLENYNAFVSEGQKMWTSGKGGFGWFDIDKPDAGLQKSYRQEGIFMNETFILEAIIQGKLWLKTTEGWAEFDPEKETFRYFDFLKATQLVQLGNGRLLADEGSGFHLLQLDSLQVSEEIPKPYVSWFKVFERPLTMPISLQSTPQLKLKPDEN